MAIANTTLIQKKSGATGNTPSTLVSGELALNYADGKLYYKNSAGNVAYFYGQNNGPSFATANINNTLIIASVPNDTLSIVGSGTVSVTACTTTKTVTITGSGGSGGSSSGYLANSVIFANTTGYLSNTSNIQFFSANNTLVSANALFNSNIASTSNNTGALVVTGGVGVAGSVYVGNRVGFSNSSSISVVYQYYNASTNSLDTVFG